MPKQKQAVGKALIRDKKRKTKNFSNLHTTDQPIRSVVEQADIEEFMSLAEMSNKEFTAEKRVKLIDTRIVKSSERVQNFLNSQNNYLPLQLPKKPQWTSETTPDELRELEKQAFYDWRRQISGIEEARLNQQITPFEKNLEIWRQLWRVLERSDKVCQIIDGRNPLFFRSPDLEDYIKELGKPFYVILNKADLIPEPIRAMWAAYYDSVGINYFFFSAFAEQAFVDSNIERIDQFGLGFEEGGPYIVSGLELLEKLREESHITIGFVGYPNVGKSSVINALSKRKLVGVTSEPGKTKHLQTLELNPLITLCDCPGLVFPSLVSSKAEMVTCGVLPIDQVKDVISPVEIICLRVHSSIIEELYGVILGGRVQAGTLLEKIALHRGFYTGSALPDEFKVGKIVLKDYVSGKLLFCHLPPDVPFEIEPEAPEVDETEMMIDDELYQSQVAPPQILVDSHGGIVFKGSEKLTKQDRRALKFAVERGADPNEALEQLLSSKQPSSYHIKSNKK